MANKIERSLAYKAMKGCACQRRRGEDVFIVGRRKEEENSGVAKEEAKLLFGALTFEYVRGLSTLFQRKVQKSVSTPADTRQHKVLYIYIYNLLTSNVQLSWNNFIYIFKYLFLLQHRDTSKNNKNRKEREIETKKSN